MWSAVVFLAGLVALGAAPPAPTAVRAGSAATAAGPPAKVPTAGKPVGSAPVAPTKAGAPISAGASPTTSAGVAVSGSALTGPIDALHRRELEDIHRQDLATALARHNILIDWREHKLPELVDWRERVEVASLIGVEHNLELDWRTMSLGDLNDIRLRASKSAELAAAFGVTIDWRLYSWRQLEELRRAVAKVQASEIPNTADGKGRKPRVAAGRAKAGGPPPPAVGARTEREAVTDL